MRQPDYRGANPARQDTVDMAPGQDTRTHRFRVLSTQHSVLSVLSSVLSPQSSLFCPQSSVLSVLSSVFSTQHSVLSVLSSALSTQHSVQARPGANY